MNLFKEIGLLRKQIDKDNYANRNYEIICSYLYALKLRMKDKERGEDNHYMINMCPPKTPNIDSYIIDLKNKNNYAIQIKQGNIKENDAKDRMWESRYKNILNANHYLYLTYKKEYNKISYNHQINVDDDNVIDTIKYIEKRKQDCPCEYEFIKQIIKNLAFSNAKKDEMDWILLNRNYYNKFQIN